MPGLRRCTPPYLFLAEIHERRHDESRAAEHLRRRREVSVGYRDRGHARGQGGGEAGGAGLDGDTRIGFYTEGGGSREIDVRRRLAPRHFLRRQGHRERRAETARVEELLDDRAVRRRRKPERPCGREPEHRVARTGEE